MSADLGGPHDGALCFNIVHHLSPERERRAAAPHPRRARAPGGTVAVLDLWLPRRQRAPRRRRDAGPVLLPHVVGRDVHRGRRARLARRRPASSASGAMKIRRLPGQAAVRGAEAELTALALVATDALDLRGQSEVVSPTPQRLRSGAGQRQPEDRGLGSHELDARDLSPRVADRRADDHQRAAERREAAERRHQDEHGVAAGLIERPSVRGLERRPSPSGVIAWRCTPVPPRSMLSTSLRKLADRAPATADRPRATSSGAPRAAALHPTRRSCCR